MRYAMEERPTRSPDIIRVQVSLDVPGQKVREKHDQESGLDLAHILSMAGVTRHIHTMSLIVENKAVIATNGDVN